MVGGVFLAIFKDELRVMGLVSEVDYDGFLVFSVAGRFFGQI